jgi:type I restriction enzyme S subunit
MRWPLRKLSEVALINPRRNQIVRDDSTPTSFIPMENVDEICGSVKTALTRPYFEVKKGYTYFEEDDVIFAKITPCMQNGKHAVVKDLIDGFGFGSTEFHAIRCKEAILPEWIHYFLRRKETLDDAQRTFTGAVGQQRVPAGFLENLEIPLPSVDDQRRIAALLKDQLTKVEKARKAIAVQLASISSLIDDGIDNMLKISMLNNGENVSLGDVISITANLVNPTLPEVCDLPHVSAENIVSITGDLIGLKSAAEDGMKSNKYLFEAGDVLYSKLRPYLRKVALPNFAGLCSADMYPLKVNPEFIEPEFLKILLGSKLFTDYANEKSARSRMPKLNREQLFSWKFCLPSLRDQRKCSQRVKRFMHEVTVAKAASMTMTKDMNVLATRIFSQAFETQS